VVLLISEKACADDAQKNAKTTYPTLVREVAPHLQIHNCLKIIKERRRKIGCGSQMGA
jgi:hypothetical protein